MADGSGKMADFVNVMIVSDHGMKYKDHEINITDIIENSTLVTHDDVDEWLTIWAIPVTQLWPKAGKVKDVSYFVKHR